MAPSNLISSVTNGDEESTEKVQVLYQSLAPRLANPVRIETKPSLWIEASINNRLLTLSSPPSQWAALQRVSSPFLLQWWASEAFRMRPSSSETYASSPALHYSYRPSGRWYAVIPSHTQYWVRLVRSTLLLHQRNHIPIVFHATSNTDCVLMNRPFLRWLWCNNDTFMGCCWCIWWLHAWILQCNGVFYFKYTSCYSLHASWLSN